LCPTEKFILFADSSSPNSDGDGGTGGEFFSLLLVPTSWRGKFCYGVMRKEHTRENEENELAAA